MTKSIRIVVLAWVVLGVIGALAACGGSSSGSGSGSGSDASATNDAGDATDIATDDGGATEDESIWSCPNGNPCNVILTATSGGEHRRLLFTVRGDDLHTYYSYTAEEGVREFHSGWGPTDIGAQAVADAHIIYGVDDSESPDEIVYILDTSSKRVLFREPSIATLRASDSYLVTDEIERGGLGPPVYSLPEMQQLARWKDPLETFAFFGGSHVVTEEFVAFNVSAEEVERDGIWTWTPGATSFERITTIGERRHSDAFGDGHHYLVESDYHWLLIDVSSGESTKISEGLPGESWPNATMDGDRVLFVMSDTSGSTDRERLYLWQDGEAVLVDEDAGRNSFSCLLVDGDRVMWGRSDGQLRSFQDGSATTLRDDLPNYLDCTFLEDRWFLWRGTKNIWSMELP